MDTPEDPFAKTVRDQPDPRYVIEDEPHSTAAVLTSLQIPAMPLGNGYYYQPGGFYTHGSMYQDANATPVYPLLYGLLNRLSADAVAAVEWVATYQTDGPEGLTALESQRQQQRLQETGTCHSFRPTDVCGGGKQLSDCQTAGPVVDLAIEWASRHTDELPPDSSWSTIAWLGRTCTDCQLSCSVAVKPDSSLHDPPITRFTNAIPLTQRIIDIESVSITSLPPPTDQQQEMQ